ncbi:excalibur calcium-binding domain-containing protein [Priestia sp. D51]|uniref:excalibur calcium-binding domain-containing protein n=1 Tax=Priestia megaterium TaxID=1404 RepID=UPI001F108F2F
MQNMQKWFGNKPTMSQSAVKSKYEKLLIHAEHNILSLDEIILKVIEAEFDKKSGKEVDGILVLTNYRLLFITKHEHRAFEYKDINDMNIQADEKDKNEWKLTIFVGYTSQKFDDIKKNDDTQEFLDILEEKILNPNINILTTVTHNFDYFLHAERLNELKEVNIKTTAFLMKRDDMGFSKNGSRLLKEKHPDAPLIIEGHYREKDKKGNFIVVDKLVYLYEYDNEHRKAKKVFSWPFSFFNGMIIDHFALKTEIAGDEGRLILNNSGKKFESLLSEEGVSFKIKTRKWYQKILGFRSGKWWKRSIASLTYLFVLLIASIIIFGEDPQETKTSKPNKNNESVEVSSKENEETKKLDQEKDKKEETARLAEEQRKKEEEAKRLAEEKQKQEEAARLAEEQRKKEEEAKRLAEEKQKQEEAARLAEEQRQQAANNVFYKNCTAVREANAAPIHKGEPGYARHLDRDGDGIACDQ